MPEAAKGQFFYTTNADNTLTITGYGGTNADVAIPANINGLTVTSIGPEAFSGNAVITNVIMPGTLTSIGENAFADCYQLINAPIPPGVTQLGDASFYQCYHLRDEVIPSGVDSIGEFAFLDTDLVKVSIPATVTNIGLGAFSACRELTNLSVASQNLFYSSSNGVLFDLQQTRLLQFPGGVGGNYAIPAGVTNLAGMSFESCTSLTSVVMPDSVIGIDSGAFAFCFALAHVGFSSNLTYIDDSAFFEAGPTNVMIPGKVESIGFGAFAASGLIQVTIPASVSLIAPDAFGECYGLITIAVDAQNPFYTSVDGVLYDRALATLEQCPATRAGSFAVPDGVTSIADHAFDTCLYLTNLVIPASVTNIGESAFSDCFNISRFVIPNGVTSISDSMFYGCYGLNQISLPESVTNIGSVAFFACNGLTNITIPSNVASIGSEAFGNCFNLRTIYFEGNAPAVDSSVFYAESNPTAYYAPATSGWPVFATRAGISTAPWQVQIRTDDGNFGLRGNQFGFNISGPPNVATVLEASTNLNNTNWSALQTIAFTNGSYYFSEPISTANSKRFFRLRPQ